MDTAKQFSLEKRHSVKILHITNALLSVRMQTPSDLVYLELGVPSAESMITQRQRDFIAKLQRSPSYDTSPLKYAADLAVRLNSPMGKHLKMLYNTLQDPVSSFLVSLETRVRTATTTRNTVYLSINPDLTPHSMYSSSIPVPEMYRIAMSRLRLSSHYLRIETGRWSRIPREERLCQCQEDIQTEQHVLLNCPRTLHIRQQFPAVPTGSINELMNFKPETVLCKFVFCVMKFATNM